MDTPELFPLKITPELFGGKLFWDCLLEIGLLSKCCPVCGKEVPVVSYQSKNFIPYTFCPTHKRRSCMSHGFFAKHNIDDPAKFVFFVGCYARRMSRVTTQFMGGFSDATMSKYRDIVEKTMIDVVDKAVETGDMLLGGDCKVVEVDEAYLVENKYGRGRVPTKKVWVVGLVEVDAPVVPLNNEKDVKAVQLDVARKEAERKRGLRRRKRKVPLGNCLDLPQCVQIRDKEGDDRELDKAATRFVVPSDDDDSVDIVQRLRMVNRMFKQAKDNHPRKALFFMVEDLSHVTLEAIINAHVKRGSMIFSDEWPGYNGLSRLGFRHFKICHKTHFSRFVLDGQNVIRVSTNHIERLWLELRKTTAYMTLERTRETLNIESYRQLRLFNKRDKTMSADFSVTFCKCQQTQHDKEKHSK